MIRNRFPPLGFKSTLSTLLRKSLLCSVAYLASNSIKMKTSQEKYQQ